MKISVLFVCTHNSARSIMAEYILRDLAGDRFDTFSAGLRPSEGVHPLALRVLKKNFGIDVTGARSKICEELAGRSFDIVITLCREARETCVPWPGQPKISHWNITDPTAGKTEDLRELMFPTVAQEIRDRLKEFCGLPDGELMAYRLSLAA